ncbi:MAG: 4-hydroxy-tetrahydrodipicolinate reductase [Bacteroidetes bacterium]|nr:4-hydroxy-tetrahydrodipicolinate reductase [Bacteroidota bacterium]
MKIALFGHGKTGKKIEEIGLGRGHEFPFIITSVNSNEISQGDLGSCDVAIDFSNTKSVLSNIKKCFEVNLPIVIGTTGWHEQYEEVKLTCIENNNSLFFASNFSIGANIMFNLNEKLASLMDHQKDYDVEITEVHHLDKKDHPSGTAITIAKGIIENLERKHSWTLEEPAGNNELIIHSGREGDVKGIHSVKYSSDIDTVELKHNVTDRAAFALGSLVAAEWLVNRTGIFGMEDLLNQQ